MFMGDFNTLGREESASPALERTSASPLTDQQLLDCFLTSKDELAFTNLVHRYGQTVWSVCRRVLPRQQDAEDAFQAVFLLLARKAASIRKPSAVGSWLYGVAYRTSVRAKQNLVKRKNAEQNLERQPIDASKPQPPWGEAAAQELQRMLDEEVDRLPEKYREPFVLCCLEGMSKTEAATALGWKEGTLSGRLAEARKLLQVRLKKRGVTLSAALASIALVQGSAWACVPAAAIQSATVITANAPSPSIIALANTVSFPGGSISNSSLVVASVVAVTLATSTAVVVLQPEANEKNQEIPRVQVQKNAEGGLRSTTLTHQNDPPEGVSFVQYSPDGDFMATADQAGKITLWTKSLAPASVPFPVRGGVAWDAAFSPKGRALAVAGQDQIQVIDPWSGAFRFLQKSGKPIRSVTFSNDGQYFLATTGGWRDPKAPNEALVFDVNQMKQIRSLVGHQGMVYRALISPDGKTIATTSTDQSIRLWEFATGSHQRTIPLNPSSAKGMVFLPDGTLVTAGWDRLVHFWDVKSATRTRVWKGEVPFTSLELSPDGNTLMASEMGIGEGPGGVFRWNVRDRNSLPKLTGHSHRVVGVAFTPDGQGAVAAGGILNQLGEVSYWDLRDGRLRGNIKVGKQWFDNVAVSPDGKQVVGASASGLSFWDLDYVRPEKTWVGHGTAITAGVLSHQGKTLITGSDDGMIKAWHVPSGELASTFVGHTKRIRCLVVSPDDKTLYSAADDSGLFAWDLATGTKNASFDLGKGTVVGLAVAPDGQTLYSVGEHEGVGRFRSWDPARGTPAKEIFDEGERVWSTAVSSDGQWLACSLSSGIVKVFKRNTGEVAQSLEAPGARTLAFSGDGQLLVAGIDADARSGFYLWQTGNWKKTEQFGHRGSVSSVSFSPDSASLATASQDGTVKLWSLPDRLPKWKNVAPLQTVRTNRESSNQPQNIGFEEIQREPSGPSRWRVVGAGVAFLAVLFALAVGAWRRGKKQTKPTSPQSVAATVEGTPEAFVIHSCPGCNKRLKIKHSARGKKVKCPHCGDSTEVPQREH